MFRRPFLFAAHLLGGLVLMTSAQIDAAVAPSTPARAGATVLHPLTIQKVQDMDFGMLSVTTNGTAVIDPQSNAMTVTGGVLPIGGGPHAAAFTGAASGNSVVNIKLPKQPVTLTRVGGTETMTISNFTLNGPAKRVMGQATSFDFRVGATLNVAAAQADGTYTGTFDVTVQYP